MEWDMSQVLILLAGMASSFVLLILVSLSAAYIAEKLGGYFTFPILMMLIISAAAYYVSQHPDSVKYRAAQVDQQQNEENDRAQIKPIKN